MRDHGVEYLFAATILMGVIQIVAGLLRLDLVMQFVSRSVITGFVNALAILIFMAQLPQLTNVGWQTYAMVAGGLAIIYGFPRITKAMPSPLVAILVLSAISIGLGLSVNTVGDMGKLPEGLPSLALPQVPLTLETLRIILPYSLTMAAVGLLESLLTAQIVDDMTDTDSDKRREMCRSGRCQHRRCAVRRHGRLRDDRAVGHQRDLGRAWSAVDLRRGRVPAVPTRGAGTRSSGGCRCRRSSR